MQACAAAGMSLSEIGAVMSRPLVGIEEEPSELERVCLRVREVRCHRPARLKLHALSKRDRLMDLSDCAPTPKQRLFIACSG